MEENELLTNDRVIAITVSIISLLATGSFFLLRYIFKKIMDEIKSYRAESLQQRSDFNNALNNKFKAINFYMRETDKLQVKHEKDIEGFHEHAREIKAKLIKHEDQINRHGEKLAQHEVEIKNLKKTG